MDTTREDRIRALNQRAERLLARGRQLARIEARARRAADTRRRILMGACIEARQRNGEISPAPSEIRTWLDAYLTRACDRVLFGLPPLP